ncbi:hypothetical protein EGW08_001045, partial [Elysia chlorotica]
KFKSHLQAAELLWTDFLQNVQDTALAPLHTYLMSFPVLKNKIAKRGRKMVDYDNARHHLESLQAAKKKDEVKIQKAQEDLKEAKKIYEDLNNELHLELPDFYNSRVSFYAELFTGLFGAEYTFHSELGKSNGCLGDISQQLGKDYSSFTYQPKRPLSKSLSTNSENGLNGDMSGMSTPSSPGVVTPSSTLNSPVSSTKGESSQPTYTNDTVSDAGTLRVQPKRKAPIAPLQRIEEERSSPGCFSSGGPGNVSSVSTLSSQEEKCVKSCSSDSKQGNCEIKEVKDMQKVLKPLEERRNIPALAEMSDGKQCFRDKTWSNVGKTVKGEVVGSRVDDDHSVRAQGLQSLSTQSENHKVSDGKDVCNALDAVENKAKLFVSCGQESSNMKEAVGNVAQQSCEESNGKVRDGKDMHVVEKLNEDSQSLIRVEAKNTKSLPVDKGKDSLKDNDGSENKLFLIVNSEHDTVQKQSSSKEEKICYSSQRAPEERPEKFDSQFSENLRSKGRVKESGTNLKEMAAVPDKSAAAALAVSTALLDDMESIPLLFEEESLDGEDDEQHARLSPNKESDGGVGSDPSKEGQGQGQGQDYGSRAWSLCRDGDRKKYYHVTFMDGL